MKHRRKGCGVGKLKKKHKARGPKDKFKMKWRKQHMARRPGQRRKNRGSVDKTAHKGWWVIYRREVSASTDTRHQALF